MVLVSKFVCPNNQYYEQYIKYINRTGAVRNENYIRYSAYADLYLDNEQKTRPDYDSFSVTESPERTSALFTSEQDSCSKEELKKMKAQFELAQKNGSPMWQTVMSFDNRFLQKYNLYDKKTNTVDEIHFHHVTRAAMAELLKRKSMEGTAIWTAAIHYNTDHIHIHIATVEPHPTRPTIQINGNEVRRGSFKKNSLRWMESKAVNTLIDRTEQREQINRLIRSNLVASKKADELSKDRKLKQHFLNLYRRLPSDRRMWNYNHNAIKHLVPQINQLTNQYIQSYHPKDFTALCQHLTKEESYLKELYGVGKLARYADYKQDKIHDLYVRMGNAILKECREYAKKQEQWNYKSTDKTRKHLRTGQTHSLKISLNRTLKKWKNQKAYEQMLQETQQLHDMSFE